MPSFRVHTVRFYKPRPCAITGLAYSDSHSLLAVSRSDCTVEVWRTRHSPVFQFCLFPPSDAEVSVESIAWAGDRLFSCGLHGQVVEYDLVTRQEAARYPVTSGPAWCLAVDKDNTTLAVGTEDGLVCLFTITEGGLEYDKVLDRQEGRILCLAWHPDCQHIVTGSTDTIRVWNIKSGQPTARMVVGRAEKNKETIVWCVAVTSDMTVISGDSRGKTSFWNGLTGSLTSAIQSHAADVLTLALSSDHSQAYSTGVDPTLMHFQTISRPGGRTKWVKSLHRVISSHDVRCVVTGGGSLYSGGVDTYLTVHTFPKHRSRLRLPPLLSNRVQLASSARCLLLSYPRSLELWSLGSTSHTSGPLGTVLPLDLGEPCKVGEVRLKEGEMLETAAISQSADFLAFTTTGKTVRLLRLSLTGLPNNLLMERVPLPDCGEDVHHLCLPAGKLLTLSPHLLSVFTLSSASVELERELPLSDLGMVGGVVRLSHTDSVLVLGDSQDNMVALCLSSLTVLSRLPSYSHTANISALAVSPDSERCLVAYSNNKVMEVRLDSGKYTQFSREEASRLPKSWLSRPSPVTDILQLPVNPDLILLKDHDALLAVLDKDKDMPEPSSKLFFTDPRATPDTSDSVSVSSLGSRMDQAMSSGLRMSRKYQHLVSLHHLTADQLVAVEVKPGVIESQLPPSLKQKKFGGL